ncbi:MAG: hydroxyacid dehydrogenase [Deltaproteobacteria bacterium]|nr:hydroxyacid dehydrogenase [Deltaproteobacteria bacterium]
MYILACDLEQWERERFGALGSEHRVAFCTGKLIDSIEDDLREAEIISVFIHSELRADLLRRLPKLRLIATRSTGTDHIDLSYCDSHGISVCNVPSYGDNTVAEHVFALILNISHKLTESIERTRSGDFSQYGLQGFDLQGKTIGVVGTGLIGRYVAGIALGFRMRVLAYDLKPDKELKSRSGYQYVDMETLLRESDVITLHVPSTPKTRHLISQKEFALMKQGVVLINTARGDVVDIKALVEALADEKVRAVGLDVLPGEPEIREEAELLRSVFRKRHNLETLLADHLLLRLRNVYITPHNAFNTNEAVSRILDTTIDNIRGYCQGKPQNVVNRPQNAASFLHLGE